MSAADSDKLNKLLAEFGGVEVSGGLGSSTRKGGGGVGVGGGLTSSGGSLGSSTRSLAASTSGSGLGSVSQSHSSNNSLVAPSASSPSGATTTAALSSSLTGSQVVNALAGSLGLSGGSGSNLSGSGTGSGSGSGGKLHQQAQATDNYMSTVSGIGGVTPNPIPIPIPNPSLSGGVVDSFGIDREILRIIEKRDGNNRPIGGNGGADYAFMTTNSASATAAGFGSGSATHPYNNSLDDDDFTVIRFGTNVSIQGSNSRYLEALPISNTSSPTEVVGVGALTSISSTANSGNAHQNKSANVFHLGVRGQGIGEVSNCLIINNMDNFNDRRPIRYGSMVCIRSPYAKDRFLGVKAVKGVRGGRLGFFRDMLTQNEKWAIVKASDSNNNSSSSSSSGSSSKGYNMSGVDETDAGGVGMYVRIGEPFLLVSLALPIEYDYHETGGAPSYRSFPPSSGSTSIGSKDLYRGPSGPSSSEQMLILNEGASSREEDESPSLVHRSSSATSFGAEFWKIELFNSLTNPRWNNRPYLSGNFLLNDLGRLGKDENSIVVGASRSAPFESLSSYPYSIQESILIRDVLLALAGIEGNYIRIVDSNSDGFSSRGRRGDSYQPVLINSKRSSLGNVSLSIDLHSADRSLASQVMQLLPLCEEAMQLKYYMKRHSRYEFGLVCHTIVANMKDLVKEYDILVAQLEHLCNSDKLTLQKMYFLLQPARVSLKILHKLARDTFDATGGRAIDLIYENYLNQGDAKARKLVGFLLEKAAEPFLNMLSLWIYRGELTDSYHEFMILEDTSISKEALAEDFNAQYWENRHTLRRSHIPRFLDRLAEKILTAGKYLNVVRNSIGQLGDAKSSSSPSSSSIEEYTNEDETDSDNSDNLSDLIPQIKSLSFDMEFGLAPLFESVELAYAFSSRALLKLMDRKYSILSHFNSLRRFFLLEHGDFFIQYMDIAEHELRKESKDISVARLQNLLNVAVQTSTLSTDLHRDDLSCLLEGNSLLNQLLSIQSVGEGVDARNATYRSNRTVQGLKGNEAFALDYRVTWPVSIVLSKRAITKYQFLSRLLYDSKHVERQLLSCWQGHQQTKQLLSVRGFMGGAYCLRQRMLHFLQNFVYYMTVEVISPRSHEMIEGMQESQDIDEVLNLHEKFLDTCLKECLLNSVELLKILLQLFNTCLQFSGKINEYLMNILSDNSTTAHLGLRTNGVGGGDIPDIKSAFYGPSAFDISGKSENKSDVSKAILKQNRTRKALNERKASAIVRDTSHESFIRQFNRTFDSQIKDFLEKLHIDSYRHQPQLANLCVRIDYNGYYSGKFDSSNNDK